MKYTNSLLLALLCTLQIQVYSQEFEKVLKVVSPDRKENKHFGFSVDISGDYVIVGIPNDNENEIDEDSLYRSGAVSIFERHADGNWYFVQKLVAPVRADKDYLGQDVSISGNYAIAGAIGEDENELEEDSVDWAGAVFLFKRNSEGSWELR